MTDRMKTPAEIQAELDAMMRRDHIVTDHKLSPSDIEQREQEMARQIARDNATIRATYTPKR